MKKMYFNFKKYCDMLKESGISPGVRKLMEKADAKLDGREVVFESWNESWGLIIGDKSLAHKDWCSKKKTETPNWAKSIGRRIRDFQEMQ